MARLPLSKLPRKVIDLETTVGGSGFVKPREARIIEIALIDLAKPMAPFYSRVRPDVDGRITTLAGTRYDPELWSEAPLFREIAPKLRPELEECCLIGHFVCGFDQPCLDAEMERAGEGIQRLGWPMLDTMQLAHRELVPFGLEALNLGACCAFLGIVIEAAHTALSDCQATVRLLLRLDQLGHLPYKDREKQIRQWQAHLAPK